VQTPGIIKKQKKAADFLVFSSIIFQNIEDYTLWFYSSWKDNASIPFSKSCTYFLFKHPNILFCIEKMNEKH